MSKLFISFLGTNDYLECNYFFNEKKVSNVKFIQEALIKIFCSDFGKDDKIIIFCTNEAEKCNWYNENDIKRRLKNILEENFKNVTIKEVKIPAGNTVEEIWDIFNIIFNEINENDRIIFDITHAFRSLPMLGIILLNYAKFLKSISIDGIYYGAFETLGPINEIKLKPVEERNAPIFDLTSFSELLEWSSGADNFVNYGNPNKINEIIYNQSINNLRLTKGKDENAKLLRDFSKSLKEFNEIILANRGKIINNGIIIKHLKENIEKIKSKDLNYKALNPLLDKISKKISDFKDSETIINGFIAVKWCIDHNLIQQGITILQENIITYLIFKNIEVIREYFPNERTGWDNLEIRNEMENCLHIQGSNILEKQWKTKKPDMIKKLLKNDIIRNISKTFVSLTSFRNDINHCGFSEDRDFNDFKNKLNLEYNNILKLFEIDIK